MATPGDLGAATQILRLIVLAVESQKDSIAVVALKDVEGRMKRRIFNKGLDSSGRGIGKYSTKPMLVGRKSFDLSSSAESRTGVAAQVLGTKKKRAKLKWVTLKGRRLAVLPGGYKAFRTLFGRQTGKVDLQMTSDLSNGIQVANSGGQPVLGFINDLSATKAAGNEDRFNKEIFAASNSELKALDKAVLREIDVIIQRIVRNV